MSTTKRRRMARPGQPSIKLHVLGAAGDVTGSLNLFEFFNGSRTIRFILDVGLNQGDHSVNHENRLPDGITATMIDFVIISHAHVDHSAWLPKLIKDGFKGFAYTHRASIDLMARLLSDSGKLQVLAAAKQNRINREQAQTTVPVEAIYSADEGLQSLKRVRALEYNADTKLADGIAVVFKDAGHILGSATVTMTFSSGDWKRIVCFTGNIGRPNTPILRALEPVFEADYIISESTYGDKLHEKRDRLKVLADIVNRAYKRALNADPNWGAGKIIIPAFSVGRVQAVLYDLRTLMEQGRIAKIPVFLDSPMAIDVTRIYRKHMDLFDDKTQAIARAGKDPFSPPLFVECTDWEMSKQLSRPAAKPVIIIGSSGMAAGGSIRKHVERCLPGRQNTILFVGHQEPGALGHTLVSKEARNVEITDRFGTKTVWINALVESMSDYSAHADYADIINWMRNFKRPPTKVFLVHGEPTSLAALKKHIERKLKWTVAVPSKRQAFDLT